MVNKIFEHILL